jgi:hypothetical protein
MEAVYWTTKSGTRINVDHMDLNHLRNTLKMIIRNNVVKKDVTSSFKLNGDIAQQYIDEQSEEDYFLDYHDKPGGGNY